ncbi:MAG: hypothetical protein B7Y82_14050 [Sphingomonadales bacterium 32-65-25]|nr:MAG: hypothetical protein B7Y82_14050 [Sphingomonadales bacterium 32-65-25]
MSKLCILSTSVCLLVLAGCDKSPSDKLGARVESAADKRATALENEADALKKEAAAIRANGEQRADAIVAADRDVSTMTQEKRDKIVANEAPAVK